MISEPSGRKCDRDVLFGAKLPTVSLSAHWSIVGLFIKLPSTVKRSLPNDGGKGLMPETVLKLGGTEHPVLQHQCWDYKSVWPCSALCSSRKWTQDFVHAQTSTEPPSYMPSTSLVKFTLYRHPRKTGYTLIYKYTSPFLLQGIQKRLLESIITHTS